MRDRTAVEFALAMTGKYDIPGKTQTVTGFDQFGHPVTETIPAIDSARLKRDAEAILAERKRADI